MRNEETCLAEDCPCIQLDCPIHGNCVECVRGHRQHKRHIPECMQEVLREQIAALAKKVEYDVVEARPEPKGTRDRAS
jgi:hypothetical protein